MRVLNERSAGLDVHKKTVVACIRLTLLTGEVKTSVRTFSTTTAGLLALADWLTTHQVTHVAIESTGVYWRPVFNILEGAFTVVLVNAQHMKAVPGRKTDVKDSEWLAELLSYGLLKASFIPPQPIRDLRDLVRYRKTLVNERAHARQPIAKGVGDGQYQALLCGYQCPGRKFPCDDLGTHWGESSAEEMADLARSQMHEEDPRVAGSLAWQSRQPSSSHSHPHPCPY
jgi:transposase